MGRQAIPLVKLPRRHLARFTLVTVALLAVTACGGGGSTPPPAYSIGGTVSGLDAGQALVLLNNGGDALTVSTNGEFTFATKVTSGGPYAVTATAPQGKACTVTGGAGTASADVASVAVSCDAVISIGGSVSGLVGKGLELELSAQGFEQVLAISANGKYVFPPIVNSGQRFGVSVKQQPSSPTQRCVVGGFGGFVSGGSDITDVGVVCGEFSYVTNAADGTVSAFAVDATTGALISVGAPATAGQAPHGIARTGYTRASDPYHLYVVNGGSNDVSAFVADSGSGALSAVPGSPFLAGTKPSSVALYATAVPDYNPPPTRLRLYLYVANSGSDDLSAYRIDRASGVLTPLLPATYATGAGPTVVAIHPHGGFLYVANGGGSNDISVFSIDGYSGALTPVAGSPFHSGAKVSALAFGVDGKFLYAADAGGGAAAIYGFSVDPGTGALTSLGGAPFALPWCTYIIADVTATRLYAAAGTNVFAFGIDLIIGALNQLPGFPVAAGGSSDTLSIDPTNQFFYVSNGSAGTVTGFALDAATGALTAIPASPFAVGSTADYIATF